MKFINKQSGFTLLETLIAMLVLSIGLLGIAGLQATSLQYNLDASSRAQVTLLAEDILSKMRIQTRLLAGPDIPEVMDEYVDADGDGECDSDSVTIEGAVDCWNTEIKKMINDSATGVITTDGVRDVTIQISWYEQGAKSFGSEAAQANGDDGDALREGVRIFSLTATL